MAQRVRQEQGGSARPGSCERAVEDAPSTEGLQVTGYATADQLRDWGAYSLNELSGDPADDAALEAVLERSSIDLDAGYLRWPLPGPDDLVTPPLRIDLSKLSVWEVDVLARACCAQALYRLELGEDLDPSTITSAPNVSFSPLAPPPVGTQALTVLSGCPSLHVYRHGLGVPDEPEPDELEPGPAAA